MRLVRGCGLLRDDGELSGSLNTRLRTAHVNRPQAPSRPAQCRCPDVSAWPATLPIFIEPHQSPRRGLATPQRLHSSPHFAGRIAYAPPQPSAVLSDIRHSLRSAPDMAGGDGEAAALNTRVLHEHPRAALPLTSLPSLLPCRRSPPRAEAAQVLGAVEGGPGGRERRVRLRR